MFGYINRPKIDKPDEVAFAREIAKNLPNKDDSTKLFYGVLGAYIARGVLKGVNREK
jgi:hypothetical protein